MNWQTRGRILRFVMALAACVACGLANHAPAADGPAKIRMGTLAPKGSSYFKHLQAMGEQWRQAPGGGATLIIYPDGTMGSEADMVRRMRLGQLQAGMLTVVGLTEIEPAVTGLQNMPMMFRTLDEVDFIGEKLEPMLEKRLAEKGFVVLGWCDTGWVRFFSKRPVIHPDDLRKAKLFVWAGNPADVDVYRSLGCNPVPLETVDILPNLETGLIDAVALPPTIALAGQMYNVAPNMIELNWAPLVAAAVITKKAWDAIPPETQAAMRKSAAEAVSLIKQDGRRESVESVEAMQKRGLKAQPISPELFAEWLHEVEPAYPKIRGTIVPADIFDEVVAQLKAYRATQEAKKK